MKKIELLNIYKKYGAEIPFKMLFDLYSDDDNIPYGLVNSIIQPTRSRDILLHCGGEFEREFNEVMAQYIASDEYKNRKMK